MSKNLGVIQALFLNMGKQIVPYFKMTPELAQQFHRNLARIMMYVKDKGVTLSQKQKDYIQNQIKQLDMYEQSLTPPTTKGPKASVTDITKKLPEDAPYSEKNPTGWMEGGTEAEMIARMKKQNKDAVKRLKEKKKTKTAEEIIDEGDFDPSGMKDGGRIGYAKGGLNYLMGL